MKCNVKCIFYFFLLLFLVNSVSILSGSIGWLNQFWITSLLFLFAGTIKSHPVFCSIRHFHYIVILLPFASIYTVYTISVSAINVYPISFTPFVSFPIGLYLSSLKLAERIISFIIISSFMIALGLFGMPNWLALTINPQPDVKTIDNSAIEFYSEDGELVNLENLRGNVIVLDFWGSYCSICFKKFPEIESLFQKYQDSVVIFAVHLIYSSEKQEEIIELIDKQPYSFPFAYTNLSQMQIISKAFKIEGIPTLVILNKKGEIAYIGSIITEKDIIVNNAYNIIDKELKTTYTE